MWGFGAGRGGDWLRAASQLSDSLAVAHRHSCLYGSCKGAFSSLLLFLLEPFLTCSDCLFANHQSV